MTMAVELILLDNVESLGMIGEKVKVADGYARNYLLPRGLASPLTEEALRLIEARKIKLQQEYETRLEAARELAKRIDETSITIAMEANEQEKLYGSVGPQQIVEALLEENISIKRECVVLPEPLRELGIYNLELNLTPEVRAVLKVWVVKV